jgi:hypothetical protein
LWELLFKATAPTVVVIAKLHTTTTRTTTSGGRRPRITGTTGPFVEALAVVGLFFSIGIDMNRLVVDLSVAIVVDTIADLAAWCDFTKTSPPSTIWAADACSGLARSLFGRFSGRSRVTAFWYADLALLGATNTLRTELVGPAAFAIVICLTTTRRPPALAVGRKKHDPHTKADQPPSLALRPAYSFSLHHSPSQKSNPFNVIHEINSAATHIHRTLQSIVMYTRNWDGSFFFMWMPRSGYAVRLLHFFEPRIWSVCKAPKKTRATRRWKEKKRVSCVDGLRGHWP